MAISRQIEPQPTEPRKGPGPDVEDLYRLSPIQQGMLYHSLSSPKAGMYFEQLLSGGDEIGDLDLLSEAWRRTTARHPILRTTFLWEGLEQPVQIVHRSVPADLRTVELPDGLSREETRREIQRIMDEDRREGFDLTRAPLARWTLVRTPGGGADGWAIWSYHHMLLDGWSALGVMREVASVYHALERGEEAELPERRPFRDYLTWLRRRGLDEAEAYWRRTLAGFGAPNRVALGDSDSAERSGREVGEHGRIERLLGSGTTTALQRAARERRVTLGTLLQGAWAAVLSRFSGDRDVVFGVTVSGRPTDLPGSESMLGCFINTLPVRVDCTPERPVGSWLAALQETQVEMRRHEHSPLVSVREWSEVPSDRQLFESILVFENFDAGFAAQEDHAPRIQRTNFPLVALAEPEGDDLRLRIGTDGNRFGTIDARRLLAALTAVLERLPGALADDRPLGDLLAPAADEAERLLEWSAEGAADDAEADDETPIHQRIAARAAETPDRVALVTDAGCWSYATLAARARELARRLTAAGAGPGDVVGVAVERSPELVLSLLGVLESGAAYLPLDPELPAERLAMLLDESAPAGEPPIVVADDEHAERLAGLERRLTVLAPVAGSDEPPMEGPARPVDPDHPAYVLYTSGSTGRPKGVVIPHRALARRLDWGVRHDLGPGPDQEPEETAFLHKTTAAFDVSVLEIFLPLLAGGRVVLARAGGQKDPAYLADRIADERVSHASFPPSVYPHLLEHDGFGRSPALRVLYTAGEEVTAELVRRVVHALEGTGTRFENRYGPTETTIGVLGWVCHDGDGRGDGPVPIGRPIAGARIHVLGPDLLPTPPGVPGELCVAGPLLARGYHRRPSRTALAFVPNPFPPATPRSPSHPQGGKGTPPPDPSLRTGGERLYRTGDLVRFRDDGAVLFLGRIDRQVKVRGFRVELEEIERALADLPRVREAAVVARRDELIAYWAPDGDQRHDAPFASKRPTGEELRRALAERLPPYMVPGAWVEMEALPRTSSLKLDPDALPEPDRSTGQVEYEPPRTDTERAIAEIWSSVLDVERIGRHDDFFQLGGHSLHLVGVAGELGKRFDPVPALADVARATTVAELARMVDAAAVGELESAKADPETLRRAARLDDSIRPETERKPVAPGEGRAILLTGATGFLGAHLLVELLRETEAAGTPVRCLVRARDEEHARERLRGNLERHRLWRDGLDERVEPLVGDLDVDRLGLSARAFEALAGEIGPIFHAAADVDVLRGFGDLASTNVHGTAELLRLACLGRPKPFCHVSTLSVLETARHRAGAPAVETSDLEDPEGLRGGYAQSKWVAERLVVQASERGLPVTVFRPGVIAGHSGTGISKDDEYGIRLYRGCLQLGMVPDRLTGPTRLSPADFVARAIVRLALDPANRGTVFHPLNPKATTIESLFQRARERGIPVRSVPQQEWIEALARAAERGDENALTPFAPLFLDEDRRRSGGGETRRIQFGSAATSEALARTTIEPPGDEAELLGRYLDEWIARRLVPEPEVAHGAAAPAPSSGQESRP